MTGQTGHTHNLHKYKSYTTSRALAQIKLGVVFLRVILNVFQVSVHTETTYESRPMRNYISNARTQRSEANYNGDTRICFLKFRFTAMNPTSPLRNSLGVSLFQLDPVSWVSFNHFLISTILILSTKRVRSCPHRLPAAHHTVGS